jgi:ankyrin repeat protein
MLEKRQNEYEVAKNNVENFFRIVKTFAQAGVDIDEKNADGKSALDIAVYNDAKKIAAFLSGTLTEENDESAVNAGGMTLHQAAEKNDAAAIMAIAATGVDLNGVKDDEPYSFGGCTPLAVAVGHLKTDAALALLSYGANPSFKDENGNSAFYYLFWKHSHAYIDSKVIEEKQLAKLVKAFVDAGFNINDTVDDESNTILLLACKTERAEYYGGSGNHSLKGDLITELFKYNPDVNRTNRFGETALMHAGSRDFLIMENVQLTLLEQGADVSATDKNGDTALHYAARNYDKNAAKTLCDMLLEFGAAPNAVNNDGKSALDIATETNNEPLVKLLLNKI